MNESIRRYASTTAERKAAAVAEIENLVKAGKPVRSAVEDVAYRTGLGERTLFSFLQKTKGLPREEWEQSLARKRADARPHKVCHPGALNRFIELCMTGRPVAICYRQVAAEAAQNGWGPLPSERTMHRRLDRQSSPSDRWLAARGAQPRGEV